MPLRRVYFYLILAVVIVAAGFGIRAFKDQASIQGGPAGVVTKTSSSGSASTTWT